MAVNGRQPKVYLSKHAKYKYMEIAKTGFLLVVYVCVLNPNGYIYLFNILHLKVCLLALVFKKCMIVVKLLLHIVVINVATVVIVVTVESVVNVMPVVIVVTLVTVLIIVIVVSCSYFTSDSNSGNSFVSHWIVFFSDKKQIKIKFSVSNVDRKWRH